MKFYSVAIANQPTQQPIANQGSLLDLIAKVTTSFLVMAAIILGFSKAAAAQIVTTNENVRNTVAQTNSVSAIVYLPDVQLQQLAPQEIRVAATQPVTDAVRRILQAYQGQDVGIRGYDVQIDPSTHQAVIDFKINNPRGVEVFESMSSASQYALFEAIRETLLSQSIYNIQEIKFTANGVAFDI